MKICDAHNDFLTEIKPFKQKQKYIESHILKNKNIKYICSQVWTLKYKNPIKYINKLYFSFLSKFSAVKIQKLLFCLEGLDFINKTNLNSALEFIKKIKPFSCGLVWNYDNYLGGGAFGKRGLTRLGKKVVIYLERNGIIIDTAHMNRKTFYDFCRITTNPIFNSHSNIYELKKHQRNLTIKQIKTIINSNGFIGLSFVQKFISDKILDAHDIALQIKYFVDKYGENNVGIGSDFFGTKPLPHYLSNYYQFDNLKIALKNVGLSNKQIKKVLCKNFVKFTNRIGNSKR